MEKWRSRVAEEYNRFVSDAPDFFRARDATVAKVFTVVKMSEEDKAELAAALANLIGKPVRIVNKIDPSIIAGMVITTADLVIDLSMASRLKKLSESIHQRIHEEFQTNEDQEIAPFSTIA
ncbi:MAG: F0F1 ATP synthase subunit delta [Firmicutes bacterium]|nr:F0F1 ATP synthase subunit delta [Bacillota bacterium]